MQCLTSTAFEHLHNVCAYVPLSTDMFASVTSVVYYAVIVCTCLSFTYVIGHVSLLEAKLSFALISMAVAWLTQNNCDVKTANYTRLPCVFGDNVDWLVPSLGMFQSIY